MAQYLHFSIRCHGAVLKHRHKFTFSFTGYLGNVAGVGTELSGSYAERSGVGKCGTAVSV
jgi:hypothetical protein